MTFTAPLLLFAFGAGCLLPARLGWWFWVATTLVQGVSLGESGPSWNLLGYVALMGAMTGCLLRRAGAALQHQSVNRPALPISLGYGWLLLVAVGYFAWASLQGLEVNSGEALGSLRRLLMFAAAGLFGAGLHLGAGKAGRRQFAWGMTLIGGVAGLLGIVEFALKQDLLVAGVDTAAGLFRVNGVAPNPIVYAFHLAWALPFALYLLATSERWPTALVAGALLGAMTLAALLTLNRQTVVIMAAVYGGALLTMRGRWLPYLWVAALLVGLAVSPKVAPKVIQRFALLGNLHHDTSFKYRRDNFRIGSEMVKAHPATGVGLGQYPFVWTEYRPDNLYYLHYVDKRRLFYLDFGYMQVATESGLIGLGIYLALLLAGAAVSLRHYAARITSDREAANWWAMLLLLLTMLAFVSMIQDTLLRPRLWITFALIALEGGGAVAASRVVPQQVDGETESASDAAA